MPTKKPKSKLRKSIHSNVIVDHLHGISQQATFRKRYVWLSLILLAASVLYWSYLSARVQQANADQLIDAYLFQSSSTFHGAIFPNQHTFLFKWPLFLLIKMGGFTPATFIAVTMATVAATVAAFTYILYRIDKRPLVFGTIVLALASVFMMVPTQPYPGALLPVNMAMVTTRNLEYIGFIAGMYLLVKNRSIKAKSSWLAVGILALVFASDKLFLDIAVASGCVALVVYALRRRFKQVSLTVDWLLVTVVAAVIAIGLIAVIALPGLAHTSAGSGTGPYGLVDSPKHLILAGIYAITGFFTNFGANPAVSALTLGTIPTVVKASLSSVAAFGYVWNTVIAVFALWSIVQVFLFSFIKKRDRINNTKSAQTTLLVIWASIASLAAFVLTNHYYVVDARYLGIFLFAGFMSIMVIGRTRKYRAGLLLLCGVVSVISVGFGAFAAQQRYQADTNAFSDVQSRNERVIGVLANHKVKVLVGDYWRVVPLKDSINNQQVSPLASCTEARNALTSTAWNTNLKRTSFAYLLTLDNGLTGYKPCNLTQIIAAYGKPNASALIAGTLSQPKELLLFYDSGLRDVRSNDSNPSVPATVLPISLDSLPNVSCNAPTIMNIVAHEDDDLLFMNPDTAQSIAEGKCVRTVYVTAGDSGSGASYWLSRERGSEAAYATMMKNNDVWIERIVSVSSHSYITVATSKANPKVSLLFMHLPDGSIHGDGFGVSRYQSLAKLAENKEATINSVDGQSSYSAGELQNALVSLMRIYHPAVVRTQSNFTDTTYPDHSDHITVGQFATTAHALYVAEQFNNSVSIPIAYYVGYPIHDRDQNVFADQADLKAAAFFAYARFDGGVCGSIEQCASVPTYSAYLTRQYQADR